MSATTMAPIGPEPVGWETEREWELEQRAFHCNENWTFEDIRQLVNDLWFQYCLAANPINIEKAVAAKDAEIERLRNKVPARALSDSELAAEITAVDEVIDGGFGEGGGSPGEWWYERADELEHERKRRDLERQVREHGSFKAAGGSDAKV